MYVWPRWKWMFVFRAGNGSRRFWLVCCGLGQHRKQLQNLDEHDDWNDHAPYQRDWFWGFRQQLDLYGLHQFQPGIQPRFGWLWENCRSEQLWHADLLLLQHAGHFRLVHPRQRNSSRLRWNLRRERGEQL